jgi:hypothetical protein
MGVNTRAAATPVADSSNPKVLSMTTDPSTYSHPAAIYKYIFYKATGNRATT